MKHKILIADDDPVLLRLMEKTLKGWDYEPVVVSTGTEAMQVLDSPNGPGIAIVDWLMPGLSGLQIVERIRKKKETRGIYLILLTVKSDRESLVKGLEAGADDFIGKPFDPIELRARLNVGVRSILLQQQLKERENDSRDSKRYEVALRESEEQLRQSQKMEAVGQLAGGIAHDFNNMISAITGYSRMILNKLPADDPLRRPVEQIQKAGDQAASLTRQLLAFSRKQVLQPKVLDMRAIVLEMETMLCRLIGENIELKTVIETELGYVLADPGQIEQVLMNLSVNARDAMPDGGKLTIQLENIDLDQMYAQRHFSVKPGRYVVLSVSDNGAGISPEDQRKIFEPFYTTKKLGKGTGLGLSTVYGIVKQSGGNIWVYSEPGHGSTFKIYLPRIDEPSTVHSSKPVEMACHSGSETVLIVEDEEIVREVTREILESYGYKVLVADHCNLAMKLCKEHNGKIDLMVTDVVMPQMNGRELFEHLSPQRPDMKVLFMSGYTDEAIVHHGVLEKGIPFIQKPFTPGSLTNKVREVIDN
jgi:two-component system, cell cycle sensor histidine kinase and response regulator CckA